MPNIPGELWLWDTATGERVAELSGHLGPVFSLAFAGDGRILASGSLDGTVKLWDVTARSERCDASLRPAGMGAGAGLLARRANTGSSPTAERLPSGTCPRGGNGACWTGIEKMSTRLAISPDGQTLASGSRDTRSSSGTLPPSRRGRRSRTRADGSGHSASRRREARDRRGQRRGQGLGPRESTLVCNRPRVLGAARCSLAISPDGRSIASGHNPAIVLWRLPEPSG